MNKTDAAETSGVTASCGRRLPSAVSSAVGSQPADRPLPSPSPRGVTPRPDVPPSTCPGEVSQPRRGLSREAFVAIAAPILARGGTWREVGDACGLGWRAAKGRGEHYGLRSSRGAGRPAGIPHTAETRARIAATLRARHAERGR